MKFIDLFAGVGGFHYGLEKSGKKFNCVWANEWDKYAGQIYQKRFPETPFNPNSITDIDAKDIPEHELLVGGFPCQAFSLAGKRKGFEETRGTLFFEIIRIAKEKRPRLLLLENVKGLLSHDKGRTFAVILNALDEIGYNVEWEVLNSKNFGVPQNRERVFIIGHLRGKSFGKIFPIGQNCAENSNIFKNSHQIANTINSTYSKNQSDGQYIEQIQEKQNSEIIRKKSIKNLKNLFKNLPLLHTRQKARINNFISFLDSEDFGGRGAKTGLYAVGCAFRTRTYLNQAGKIENRKDNISNQLTTVQKDSMVEITSHSPRTNDPKLGGSGPLRSNKHCFTIDRSPHIVNRIRRLTPVECERLQGFPDGWTKELSDSQRYKCMGNAVTTKVVQTIGEKILQKWSD